MGTRTVVAVEVVFDGDIPLADAIIRLRDGFANTRWHFQATSLDGMMVQPDMKFVGAWQEASDAKSP